MDGEGNSEHIAVIGSGLMGHGIAQVFAQRGFRVTLQDLNETLLENAKQRIRLNLKALSEMGLQKEKAIDEIVSGIASTVDLAEAVHDADFVIESVTENLQLKREVFRKMASYAPSDAILASNSSMLTISDIGRDVENKERLVITHWFNPPYLIPVVEVVKGAATSQDTVERTIGLLERMDKVPVRVLKEVPGHLLNRIQFALFRETLALLQEGVATAEEIDKGVSGSLGLRFATIGPLRSIDLAGLDLFWYGMRNMYQCLDNSVEPQQIIHEKVKTGHAGRKARRGFFEYQGDSPVSVEERERDTKTMEILKILYPKKEKDNG
jgi:3-hydroxybutyryl-CoA dehydrogenase